MITVAIFGAAGRMGGALIRAAGRTVVCAQGVEAKKNADR